MTPLQIQILLHYYCSPTDFRDGDFTAPAVHEAIEDFEESGFLRLSDPSDQLGSILVSTDKNAAFINALCSIPEPIQKWVIPVANEVRHYEH